MRPIALVGLALSLSLPALAETPDWTPPAPPAAPEAAPTAQLPLDAMRHHQPRAADVEQREIERFGRSGSSTQTQRQQRSEVDQLFEEIMRRSAPPKPQ